MSLVSRIRRPPGARVALAALSLTGLAVALSAGAATFTGKEDSSLRTSFVLDDTSVSLS